MNPIWRLPIEANLFFDHNFHPFLLHFEYFILYLSSWYLCPISRVGPMLAPFCARNPALRPEECHTYFMVPFFSKLYSYTLSLTQPELWEHLAQIQQIQPLHGSFSFYGLIPRTQLPGTLQTCHLNLKCSAWALGSDLPASKIFRRFFPTAKSKMSCPSPHTHLKSAFSQRFYIWCVPDESTLDYTFPHEHWWACVVCVCPFPTVQGSGPLLFRGDHRESVFEGLICYHVSVSLLNHPKTWLFGIFLTFFIRERNESGLTLGTVPYEWSSLKMPELFSHLLRPVERGCPCCRWMFLASTDLYQKQRRREKQNGPLIVSSWKVGSGLNSRKVI